MKILLSVCAGLLFLAIVNLPIDYYTFLRIVITIGCAAVIINEINSGFSFWIIIFGIIGILFNPIIPVYLNDKFAWMPIDLICGILFVVKAFFLKVAKS